MDQTCGGSVAARRIVLSLSILASIATAAQAAEIKFPQAKPVVALDVPDGWTIDKANGLEIRSPDKNAIIVADIIKRDKARLDAWAKAATEKIKSFGIAFDPKVKAPPTPLVKPIEAPSAFTTRSDKFTFSGQPSLAPPGTPGSNDPVKPGPTSLEALTSKNAPSLPVPGGTTKLPLQSVKYYGATRSGKPVDMELAIYTLPDKRLFVMMQESGTEDDRTVIIAKSVRGLKPASK